MKDSLQTKKVYNLIEGVLSRTRVLDDGITDVKKIEPNQIRET